MASQPNFIRAEPVVAPSRLPPGPNPTPQMPPKPAPAGEIRSVDWRDMQDMGSMLAWDALAMWASEPNPFFESWYLLPALRGLDPDGRVRILRFEMGGDLAGIMPIVRQSRYYTRPIPHWASWAHPNGFLGAPLVVRGMERSFWRALLAWADAQGGLGLFLHLGELPLSGAVADGLRDVLNEQGRNAALVGRKQHVMLQSDLSPEAYFEAAVSGKKRKEYRRQANRLGELGELAFVRHEDEDDLSAWCEDFLKLEAAGWKGEAGSALACLPATTALWREGLHGAAARGRLERLSMTLDGRPIAMLATFMTKPGAFMFKTAYDETLSAYSPGVLLQRENLAMLDMPGLGWVDSCADETHPMITHLWHERRPVGRVSIEIGGAVRRGLFGAMARRELGGAGFGI
ncbi:GNAT family N-acetyltransferase [Novosphingobium sediminicola]|uniref:CelD/BcsL family acetyltransferase involved in cellulose biosynthesis n=1 Tax=Novosphingobium sediminicola TaxID=563162 RepID=A0A7W6CGK9_9SPHN|nr:CelD/BcsL family acetyltransferase involved in cellulose biosynthesis [Novosphingobium sediminicola]